MRQGQEALSIRVQNHFNVWRPLGDAEVVDDGLAAAPRAAGFDGDEEAPGQGYSANVVILRPLEHEGQGAKTACMCSEVQPIDVTDSADLLELAEEVRRSGVGRLLKRGEQELALLTPVNVRRETRPEQPRSEEPDALLSIIGIGESVGPTDVARHDAKAVLQGLRESRGALRGVDTEALLADLAEQRSQDPSRRSG